MNKDSFIRRIVNSNRSFLDYLGVTAKGFCMGAADVVPGVSGGTMAFILGIYEELIGAIRSFDSRFIKLLFSSRIKEALEHVSWKFLISVGLGIFMAILSLARILSWLLQNQPILIWAFFFGLVLASVFTVSRHLSKLNLYTWIWILLGAIGAYFLVGMVPVSTPNTPWFLFLSGAVAICAMILPGISGAFILLLLAKYHFALEAVNNRDLFPLLIMAAGAAFGLLAFSRLLHWLLKNYHDMTIALLTGLMLGSLRKVWPWKETLESRVEAYGNIAPVTQVNVLPSQWSNEVTLALFLMAVGFLVVLFLNRLAKKKR